MSTLMTIPETVAALVREGVTEPQNADAVQRALTEAMRAAGYKPLIPGRKYIRELGGIVDTLVDAAFEIDVIDEVWINADLDYNAGR